MTATTWRNDPNDPRVIQALTWSCDLCGAPRGTWCWHPFRRGVPAPGRPICAARVVDRRREGRRVTGTALAVSCPYCRAAVGDSCRNTMLPARVLGTPHRARIDAWLDRRTNNTDRQES